MSESDIRLTRLYLERLREPFPAESVKWKPQVIARDGRRAMAVAYIDARDVQDRLDAVAGGDWHSRMTVIDNGHVLCELTVMGTTRSDVGDCDGASDRVDPLKGATSDALKRAAVSFGIARYLYSLPLAWVDYDERRGLLEIPELPQWALPDAEKRANARPADAPRTRQRPAVATSEAEARLDQPGETIAQAAIATVRKMIADRLGGRDPREASEKQQVACARLLGALFEKSTTDDESRRSARRQLIEVLTGVKATNEQDNWELLEMHEAGALIDWAKCEASWDPNPDAISQAAAILAEFGEAQGQQALPMGDDNGEAMDMGDKIALLVRRCWQAYLGEPLSGDEAIGIAAEIFEHGYSDMSGDEVAFAIVSHFDRALAQQIAEETGANLPNAAMIVGAITEAAGRAGQHTTPSALQARAHTVRNYVGSLVEEGTPF